MPVRGMWGAEFAALSTSSTRRHLDGIAAAPGGAGSATTQAASARSGSFGYRVVSGPDNPAWLQFGGDPVTAGQRIAWRFYMKLDALPAQKCRIADFGDDGNTFNQSVYLNPDGRIDFGGFPPIRPDIDNPLPVGSWIRIELAMSYSVAGTGRDLLCMRINGTTVYKRCRSLLITATGSVDSLFIGWRDSPGGVRTMHIDDVTITEGIWPGDGQVIRLMATNHILGEGWVPGMWQNIENLLPEETRDPLLGTKPDCSCGALQNGTFNSEAPDSGLITGMNAAPPVGVIAAGTADRADHQDKMASTPGLDLYNLFQGWGGGGCAECPVSALSSHELYQWTTRLHRYASGAGGYLTAQLAVNGDPIRAANWRAAVAGGLVFPIGGTGGQSLCKIRLPALEPDVVNFDFNTIPQGGNWPTAWTTIEGPVHQNPSAAALATLDFHRQTADPAVDATRGQVCILTVVIDSSTEAELLPVCQPLMTWT